MSESKANLLEVFRSGDSHTSRGGKMRIVKSDEVARESQSECRSQLDDVRNAVTELQQRFAFLDEYTVGEACLMSRLGEGGRSFIERALEVAESNENILPRSFDLDSFRREVSLLRDLGALADELKGLAEGVSSGEGAIGSQAFAKALVIQQAAKMSNADEGLGEVLNEWADS